ncbi:MAG: O-acetylhomoserine aminocarboxypropyltransferase/cysteine synthase family protein [Bacillota bacterium]
MPQDLHFDTLQLHAGHEPDPTTFSRAVPIYQTTSYVFENVQHGADLFSLTRPGNIYTRIMNPTTEVLEKRMAALENAAGALATASGMAAITYAIQTLARAGDEIVSLSTLYGGTYTLFARRLPRQGITARLVPPDDLGALEASINEKTRAIYIETLGNPEINIPDFDAIAAIAQKHRLPLVADNTFGTPYLIQLKDYGVNIAVHSLTKYLGGHGTSIGGCIVDYGNFDWASGRFDEFTTPDDTYHGLVYANDPAGFVTKARVQMLRDTGACISPFNAFLILMGIETLSLRVERHSRNAEAVAEFLQSHPAVAWVNYPALAGSKYYARAQKYFPKGVGGILSFGVKGGREAAKILIENLQVFSHLANVADAKSLVIHPASTTHAQLNEEELVSAGVLPEAIRLSIGLEDKRDLIADLGQALSAAEQL